MSKGAGRSPERELYAPVKAFLENQGYTVRGEVRGCDLVGVRGNEPPVVVELKRKFNLELLVQGVDRLGLTGSVYLAVDGASARGAWRKRPDSRVFRKLCRMLGLGLILVFLDRHDAQRVQVLHDPAPYRPRINKRKAGRLLSEHQRRTGDHNTGGVTRTKIVTAYRQEALCCAQILRRDGPSSLKALRASGRAPNAAKILQIDYYGWFQRTATRGVYTLSENGLKALDTFAGVLDPVLNKKRARKKEIIHATS